MSEFTKFSKKNPLLFNWKGEPITNKANIEMLIDLCSAMYEALEKAMSLTELWTVYHGKKAATHDNVASLNDMRFAFESALSQARGGSEVGSD